MVDSSRTQERRSWWRAPWVPAALMVAALAVAAAPAVAVPVRVEPVMASSARAPRADAPVVAASAAHPTAQPTREGATRRSHERAADATGWLAPPTRKQRLLVLTDIEADPDDTQSLIRLLLYSNEIDIEGLVATTSVHQKDRIAPASIHRILDRYAQVQPMLRRHDAAYPAAAALHALVGAGQPAYGMAAVGPGKDSDGARRLITALRAPDPRPLWVAVWGGPNTLAQALMMLKTTQPAGELARLLGKLRVYAISDQDDSAAWIRREFPSLFYVVSPGGYGAATWTGIKDVIDGIDNTSVSNAWLAEHIQQGHGPLGAAYPDVAYGMEGDTPSFLGLIPNGLSDPERPDWGGWGGRYVLRVPDRATTDPDGFNGGVPVPQETRAIWTNAVDTVSPYLAQAQGRAVTRMTRSFSGFRETLWRWRDDLQNDFAARMAWTNTAPAHSNHPPIVQLAHADHLQARSGEPVALSAVGSHDPDGDSLSYLWFAYPEAGTCVEPIALWGAENLIAIGFTAPRVAQACDVHLIVRVSDKGSPALSRYRRVVVTVQP